MIYWLRSPNNVLTGNDSATQIMSSEWSGDTWSTERIASLPASNVVSLDAGYGANGPRYAAVLDMNNDVTTTSDLELWVDGTRLTNNNVADSGVAFCGGSLYWLEDGIVRDEAGTKLLPDGMQLGSDRFQVYRDETDRIAVVFTLGNGAYAEVYGVFVDQSKGTVSQPTQLTTSGECMEAGTGFYSASAGLVLPCAQTQVTNNGEFSGGESGSEDVALPFGQTDLTLLTYGEESHLVIEDVYYDASRLVAGNNFTVNVLVKNTGVLPAKGFDVVLWDDEKHMPQSSDGKKVNPKAADYRAVDFLPGGEETEVALTFLLPEPFEGDYVLTLTPGNDAASKEGDYDDETVRSGAVDSRTVTFSSKDIILRAEAFQAEDETPIVRAIIGNCGVDTCTLPVSLYAVTNVQREETMEQVEALLETKYVTIEKGSQEAVSFELTDANREYDHLRVEVRSVDGEINTANNSDFCVLQEEDANLEPLSILGYTPGSSSVSARISVNLPSGHNTGTLVVAGYSSSGKMLCSQHFSSVSSGNRSVSLAGTAISYIQCFLLDSATLEPLCESVKSTQ